MIKVTNNHNSITSHIILITNNISIEISYILDIFTELLNNIII